MGITAGPSYTTDQGFVLSPVYLSLNAYRFQRLPDGKFQCVFSIQAFKSREDKATGRAALNLPTYLCNGESFLAPNDFYRKSIFAHGYDAAKSLWQRAGYTVDDIHESGQPGSSEFVYNSEGYDIDGFNGTGYDRDGYDRTGFTAAGYDRDGYDRTGYNAAGYDRYGYDREGYTVDGYNRYGYNREGYNVQGFNAAGYDREGYNVQGFNAAGYDRDGYDSQGYNAEGVDRDGNPRPVMDASGSTMTTTTDISGAEPSPTEEPAPEAP